MKIYNFLKYTEGKRETVQRTEISKYSISNLKKAAGAEDQIDFSSDAIEKLKHDKLIKTADLKLIKTNIDIIDYEDKKILEKTAENLMIFLL